MKVRNNKCYKLNKKSFKEITSYIVEEDIEIFDYLGNCFFEPFTCICRDGIAVCRTKAFKEPIILRYPKLKEVLSAPKKINEVLKYRGLSSKCKIHYGDIMLKYGTDSRNIFYSEKS